MTAPAIILACPECGAPMELRNSRFGPFYGCSTWTATRCPGTHGAHPNGAPLGIPADHETKLARIRAHEAFDGLWRSGLTRSRRAAYRWLREALGLSKAEAHIGRFTRVQCEQLISEVWELKERRAPNHDVPR